MLVIIIVLLALLLLLLDTSETQFPHLQSRFCRLVWGLG